jgi:4'-phosphopantetheinyl transferase
LLSFISVRLNPEGSPEGEGLGLRLLLDQFAIPFSGPVIGISLTREIDDDPERWHFTRHSPSPQHRLTIADGSGTPGGLTSTMRPWPVPHVKSLLDA